MKYFKKWKKIYYRVLLAHNELILQGCLDDNLRKKIQNKIIYYQKKVQVIGD
ncbi:hypothetical protein [Ectobacillus funiculus]|uniref:Uncharacterized protein n=1 Tax=Ectobacillus funiculus TaxID=137993 RepID=A0ABV5WKV7_9BACI